MEPLQQWIAFFGRFHPVVLHLPIGAVFAVAAMEFLPLGKLRKELWPAQKFLLVFATGSALLAIITGLFLEQEGGYGEERIFWHKLLGILMTCGLGLASYIAFRSKSTLETPNWPYRGALAATVALLVVGSHQGGVMTHGRDFLTEHFPLAPGEDASRLPAVADAGFTVAHSPAGELIEGYCVDCHNPDRRKGKLDLESILASEVNAHQETWRTVIEILKRKEMPPLDQPELPRPADQEYLAATEWLNKALEAGNTVAPAMVAKVSAEASNVPAYHVFDRYCTSCHSGGEAQSGLDIERLLADPVHHNPGAWENIVRKMNARQMPPLGRKRPDPKTYADVIAFLETELDAAVARNPNPGRTSTFRRLTRAEYANAIRDLLALEVDVSELLPRDEVSHGFDNITVTELSPTLLERYISAAQKISRLAVGRPLGYPTGDTFRAKPDLTQEGHFAGMPLGSRGGMLIPYNFPRTGTYEIEVYLARDRNESVEGLHGEHEIEFLLNSERLEVFTVKPPVKGKTFHKDVDKHLRLRTEIPAGPQEIAVTFIKKPKPLLEQRREPFEASFNFHRHPRQNPAVYQVSITGPMEDRGVDETPSRQKIFGGRPIADQSPEARATEILSGLARLAYRRPVTDEDIANLMVFFKEGFELEGFEAGIEFALSAILVNPNFLFRIEQDPPGLASGSSYKVNDYELATRLSFFLWSSIPDAELLALAEKGDLSKPAVLKSQTIRMLEDPRSRSLTDQFAAQWLYLRNLESVTPNLRLYPDFDDNLRQAMRRETELLFEHVKHEDRSVLELLTADYTFLNERLAKHYNIAGIYGDRFRQVELGADSERGGLLRHGSILSVTSYANRTSPVIRGAWILENIVGAPPPPPPPDVPALEDTIVSEKLPIRERLAAHRADPGCASCHELMDPIGFALEAFDAMGQRRWLDNGQLIDASGELADGSSFVGVDDLEATLLRHPENFVSTMTEKLLIFALGRGIEYYDMPAVRDIVKSAATDDYKFSSLILGIVSSEPFQKRTTP